MPFAVLETINARGCKELSVVPDKWLRNSRSGSIVLWPNARSVAEQEKLLRDENSRPKKSWLKYKCTVKRNPISSFAEATRLLDELSGESSSDVSQLVRRKRKHNKRETENFQKMLVLENTPHSLASQATSPPSPVIIEVRGSVPDGIAPQVTAPHPPPPPPPPPPPSPLSSPQPPAPPAARIAVIAAKFENNVQTDQYEILPHGTTQPPPTPPAAIAGINEDNVQTIEYVTYETVQGQDALMEAENLTQESLREIINTQHQINHRLDRLEKRTANICTQNEFILDAIRKLSSRVPNIEEPPSFYFDPSEHEQQLADLELKLESNDFKSKMLKWLRLNVSGDCADNRMLGVLDLLFSKEFQTKCTWTGASRKGPKIAIMPNRNILQLFQQIGNDESEIVTQQKLASFFMRKLKNSLKRMIASGLRRGTRHVRRRRQQRKADEQEEVSEAGAGSSITSSNVLNGMNEHADDRNNSRSEPESEEMAGSIVDSSDALDHADVLSDASDVNDSSE